MVFCRCVKRARPSRLPQLRADQARARKISKRIDGSGSQTSLNTFLDGDGVTGMTIDHNGNGNPRPAPRPIREGIEFQNVSFAYPGSVRTVLKDVNCYDFFAGDFFTAAVLAFAASSRLAAHMRLLASMMRRRPSALSFPFVVLAGGA